MLNTLRTWLDRKFSKPAHRSPNRRRNFRPAIEMLEERTVPTGLSLDYSTLLDGAGQSVIRGMTTNGAGDLYITGLTTGQGFPTTAGAYRTTSPGGFDSAFIAELNPQGQIIWSTLFGAPGAGDTYAYAISLDAQNDVYISGRAARDCRRRREFFSRIIMGAWT